MPDEFMRGGGCFAPEATVDVVGQGPTRLDALSAGQRIKTADGGTAAVRCVVLTQCAGGRAVLAAAEGEGGQQKQQQSALSLIHISEPTRPY